MATWMWICLAVFSIYSACFGVNGWGNSKDKILLKDVQVLTLQQGQMTKGRRSSPIDQLTCKSSGSAGCPYGATPRVVQCYNRGANGHDVQWECKADIDSAYKFGRLSVSCEGYDHRDDSYVLEGSCGLEYELDMTSQGHSGHQHGQQQHYGGGYNSYGGKSSDSSWMVLILIGVAVYAVHRWRKMHEEDNEDASDRDARQSGPAPPRNGPPPSYDQSEARHKSQQTHSQSTHHSQPHAQAAAGGQGMFGGFFGGAATGGILGYLLGSRNRTHYGHHQPYNTGYGWGSGYGSGSGWGGRSNWGGGSSWGRGSSWGGSSFGSSGSSSRSSGSRTTSGFGGTSRR